MTADSPIPTADRSPVRLAVVGVGAVGGWFASDALATGVADVTLCVRRRFDELVVDSRVSQEELRHPVRPLADPGEVAVEADVVLVTTKAHQVDGAAGWLEALCGPTTLVVAAQNGVEQVERMSRITPCPVLPAVVYCGAELHAPGQVEHHSSGFLFVPQGDAAERIRPLFGDGVIRPSRDWTTRAWQKLTLNVVSNGLTALTGRRMDVLCETSVEPVAAALARECAEVGRAEGAELGESWPVDAVVLAQAAPAGQGTSMLFDRLAGRELEWDALYGAVQRGARRHGVEVPVTDVVSGLLAAAR